jgi:hypothetical protein
LTTFIDHRPYPGRVSPYERPIMGQINTRRASNCSSLASRSGYCPQRKTSDSRPSIRQKGARRSSGQDRKDQVQMGGLSPHAPNTSRKIAVYRSLHHRGIPVARPLKTFC